MNRANAFVLGIALVAGLCGCSHSAPSISSPRSSTTSASGAAQSPPADPSMLVLRAADYPEGRVDEQGRADLYDEPPAGFKAVLDASGLSRGSNAFTRSFHITDIRYGLVTSFAVVLETTADAARLFRDGAPGLLVFNGFAGGRQNRTPVRAPAGLATEAVAFSAPGLNGGTSLAVVWLRNRAVGLLVVDRSDGDPRPELERLSKLMDNRMRT